MFLKWKTLWIPCHSAALSISEYRDSYSIFILVKCVFFVDFSEKKTNNNRETEKASNNSSQQKQARNKDQSPEPQSVQQDTKKSIASGVVGRGRKK
jgi:hypothetical protein